MKACVLLKMPFETEDSSRISWFMGIVSFGLIGLIILGAFFRWVSNFLSLFYFGSNLGSFVFPHVSQELECINTAAVFNAKIGFYLVPLYFDGICM